MIVDIFKSKLLNRIFGSIFAFLFILWKTVMGVGTPELDRYEREEKIVMLNKGYELIKYKLNKRPPIRKYMKYKSSKEFQLNTEFLLGNPIDVGEGGEATVYTALKDIKDL